MCGNSAKYNSVHKEQAAQKRLEALAEARRKKAEKRAAQLKAAEERRLQEHPSVGSTLESLLEEEGLVDNSPQQESQADEEDDSE